ncbi:MAG: hypothetical protein GWP10_02080 [Nitrospiraceae bacterium]|nr:hypothetical protein [Nitrospiraceae bacterium]
MNFLRSIRVLGLVMLFTVALVLSGCKKEGDLKFNHELHVVENEIACGDCHTAGDNGKMGNPSMDKCGECHDIDMDNPSKKCLMCHSPKSAKNDYEVSTTTVPKVPKSYDDVIFSHEYHDGIDCGECHKGLNKDKKLAQIQWPDMPVCEKCHNGDEAPKTCDTCHKEIRKDRAPESHHGDWESQHGLESEFDPQSCTYCHGKDRKFCQDCHQTQKPKDHTAYSWKTTEHGEEATHDRHLCATCHTASYCQDCHRSQKPISHRRADWMALSKENGHAEEARRNFRSCNVCHTTDDCMKCHQNIILRRLKK